MLKKFCQTLTKGAFTWYTLLPEHSIDFFAILVDIFVKAYAAARKFQTHKEDIFKIKQREGDMFQSFVEKFQRERMMLPIISEDWAVAALPMV